MSIVNANSAASPANVNSPTNLDYEESRGKALEAGLGTDDDESSEEDTNATPIPEKNKRVNRAASSRFKKTPVAQMIPPPSNTQIAGRVVNKPNGGYNVEGTNIGSKASEPDWNPEQLQQIANACDTMMRIDKVPDTRRSQQDKDGKYSEGKPVIFNWSRYEDKTLRTFVNMDAIKPVATRLVDHAPDRLLNLCINSIRKLYDVMNEEVMNAMMAQMTVNEGEIENASTDNDTAMSNQNVHPATSSNNQVTQPNVIINPFGEATAQKNANRNPNAGNNFGGNSSTSKYGEKSDGPYMFPKRSQLGQLLDPTGKGVSQQTITIDNFNTKCEQLLNAQKEVSMNIVQFVERQAKLMGFLSKQIGTHEQMFEEAVDFIETVRDKMEEAVKIAQESMGVIKGLHAVVEGNRGIYELMTMPVAPLLRGDDGTPMTQYVYGPTLKAANINSQSDQNSSIDQNGNTQTSTTNSASNPFVTNTSMSTSSINEANENLIERGDDSNNEIAQTTPEQLHQEDRLPHQEQERDREPQEVQVQARERGDGPAHGLDHSRLPAHDHELGLQRGRQRDERADHAPGGLHGPGLRLVEGHPLERPLKRDRVGGLLHHLGPERARELR